jgi:hypothetical protein
MPTAILFLTMVSKICLGEKTAHATNDTQKTQYPVDLCLSISSNINSKWIRYINVRLKTLKLLEIIRIRRELERRRKMLNT